MYRSYSTSVGSSALAELDELPPFPGGHTNFAHARLPHSKADENRKGPSVAACGRGGCRNLAPILDEDLGETHGAEAPSGGESPHVPGQ
mmetsp:Transcript_36070/g.103701  ORF Transcript_36070/g.103701 Transcript_36070/m.103701 type:complete len:89 (+) Transcript_36070:1675-1941(+)